MLSQIRQLFGGGEPPERSPEEQRRVERECAGLTLYHFPACPFCRITRRKIRQLGLPIAEKNIQQDPQALQELVEGGGRRTVPCLRIDGPEGTQWMYESGDIVRWLEERFGG